MSVNDDILIDNFLRGNLSQGEISDFENRLKTDEAFRENYMLEKALWQSQNKGDWSHITRPNAEFEKYKDILKSEEIKALKQSLDVVQKNYKPKNKPYPERVVYYVIAASVIILLGFQFFFNKSITDDELYAKYVSLNDLPSFVSRSDDSNQLLVKAQSFFEKKAYGKALQIFQSYNSETSDKALVLIYKGLSQIQLKKYTDAEETFDSLINSDLLDAQKGYWYKALLHLKTGKKDKAKTILNTILSNRFYNYKKVEVLLAEID